MSTDQARVSIRVIALMAMLSAAGVRRDLLQAAGQAGLLASGGRRMAAGAVDDVLADLAGRSLLSPAPDGRVITMDRPVAEATRSRLAGTGQLPAAARAAATALEAWARVLDVAQQPAAARDFPAQVAALAGHAAQLSGPDGRDQAGDDRAGEGRAGERRGGEDQADRALTGSLLRLRFLALYYLVELGDSAPQAIALGEPLTADLERELGPDHPDTLNARNSLAAAYLSAGRPAEAVPLFERTLVGREKALGPNHPETLTSQHNLAAAYQDDGRPGDAILLLRLTLAARERLLGADHQDTLNSLGNLAAAYRADGRTAEAIPLLERTLAGRERVLGAGHPATEAARSNLDYARRGVDQPAAAPPPARPPAVELPAPVIEDLAADHEPGPAVISAWETVPQEAVRETVPREAVPGEAVPGPSLAAEEAVSEESFAAGSEESFAAEEAMLEELLSGEPGVPEAEPAAEPQDGTSDEPVPPSAPASPSVSVSPLAPVSPPATASPSVSVPPRAPVSPPAPAPSMRGPAPVPKLEAPGLPPTAGPGQPAVGTRARRPVRLPWVAAGVLVLIAASGTAGALSRLHAGSHSPGPVPAGRSKPAGAAELAANWVSQQVSHTVTVACDPLMCAALEARGVPTARLLVLRTGTASPRGAGVVVATPAVRSEFGSRLDSEYAPLVLAGFGSGPGQVNVQAVAPAGAAAYRAALRQDQAARKRAGTQLLANKQVGAAGQARTQLADGAVDSRLLILIPALAATHPIQVLAFGDAGPGAGPDSPLCSADLSGSGRPAGMTDASYQRWVTSFVRAQLTRFTGSVAVVRQDGQTVVRVQFSRPSPLGLLTG